MLARMAQHFFPLKQWAKRCLPRYSLVAVFLFASVLVLGLTFPNESHAFVEDIANGFLTFITWFLLLIANLFIQITIFLLRFFILVAGYNNYINAEIVTIGWNMVRDVANMFFIVILMVIAFGTILGLEQYEWRKSLVKLLLAAILINFSNLLLQLVIDAAQVFTITFLNAVAGAAGGNLIEMFNFEEIFTLSSNNPERPTNIRFDLVAAGIMSLIFSLVAMISIGAYAIVMVIRVVVLWVSIILSPLMILLSVLPQTRSQAQEFWQEFTHHVIAGPLMVFFLWLAFATFGTGSVAQQLQTGHPLEEQACVTQECIEGVTGNSPSASISEAGTWENMASFIVGIAFLWLGLERVQKLGVKGGSFVSSAASFAGQVAAIASGVTVARWIGESAKDAGSDYLKLAGEKTRLNRMPIFGSQRASKIKRKAAVKKVEDRQAARAEEITQRGGGLAGYLAPSAKSRAKQTLMAENAKRESDAQGEIVRAEEQKKMLESEQKRIDPYVKQAIKEAGVKKFSELSSEKQEEVLLRASENEKTDLYKGKILESKANRLKNISDKAVEENFSKIDLDQLKYEDEEVIRRMKKEEDRLIQQKVEEKKDDYRDAFYNEEKEIAQKAYDEAVKKHNELQQKGADRKEINKARIARNDAFNYLNDVKAGNLSEERVNDYAQNQAAKDVTSDERAKAMKKAGIMKGLLHIQEKEAIQKAAQPGGKLKSYGEDVLANVTDYLRALEGKRPDTVLNRQMGKIHDEFKEWGNTEDYALIGEVGSRGKELKEMRKALARGEKVDMKVLKSKTESMMRAIASAMDRSLGSVLAGELADINESYRGKDLLNPENIHKLVLGLASGKDYNEFDSDEKASEIQEDLRKLMREKGDTIFRTVQTGMNNAVSKNGQQHFAGQMSSGIDAQGNEKIGFTNIMRAGIGKAKQLGTADTRKSGQAKQSGIRTGMVLPTFGLTSTSDANAFVREMKDANGNTVILGFHEGAEEAVMSMVGMSAVDIRKINAPILRKVSGGGYDKSSWDGKQFNAGRMKGALQKIHKKFEERYAAAKGDRPAQTRVVEAMREYYRKLGVQQIDGKDIDAAEFSNLTNMKNKIV